MDPTPKTSKRAAEALSVLNEGGYFRHGLERNSYTGREQFRWSLKTARGHNQGGIGKAAFEELKSCGFTFTANQQGFSGAATHYSLRAPT